MTRAISSHLALIVSRCKSCTEGRLGLHSATHSVACDRTVTNSSGSGIVWVLCDVVLLWHLRDRSEWEWIWMNISHCLTFSRCQTPVISDMSDFDLLLLSWWHEVARGGIVLQTFTVCNTSLQHLAASNLQTSNHICVKSVSTFSTSFYTSFSPHELNSLFALLSLIWFVLAQSPASMTGIGKLIDQIALWQSQLTRKLQKG